MNILEAISSSVEKVTNDEHEISPDTHLVNDMVLDSLDSAVFLLELEKIFDIKIDDDIVDREDLFQVSNLITHIENSIQ